MTTTYLFLLCYCLKVPTNSLGDFSKNSPFLGYGKCRPMENKSVFPTGLGQQKHVAHTYHSPYNGGSFFSCKRATVSKKGLVFVVCCAVCDTPCKAGRPSHYRRPDNHLLTRACVRRCSLRPLRSGDRSLKQADYAKIRANGRNLERGTK